MDIQKSNNLLKLKFWFVFSIISFDYLPFSLANNFQEKYQQKITIIEPIESFIAIAATWKSFLLFAAAKHVQAIDSSRAYILFHESESTT
uniref:Uncharacterized protein n=1 Tax=Solanum lycopersicum TaxID=4081 RepID=A0A3Q7FIU7_SOLLC